MVTLARRFSISIAKRVLEAGPALGKRNLAWPGSRRVEQVLERAIGRLGVDDKNLRTTGQVADRSGACEWIVIQFAQMRVYHDSGVLISSVLPSGSAREATSVPIVLLAPGRFSTTTLMFCARPMWSARVGEEIGTSADVRGHAYPDRLWSQRRKHRPTKG